MAIVLNPLNSAAASGSVGGINYTRWRGSSVVRTKANPTQPNTAAQVAIQNIMIAASQAWGGLTDTERARWESLARVTMIPNRLQQRRALCGYHLFLKRQCLAACAGFTGIVEPNNELAEVNTYAQKIYHTFTKQVTMVIYSGVDGSSLYRFQWWQAPAFTSAGRSAQLNEYDVFTYTINGNTTRTGLTIGSWYHYRGRVIKLSNGMATNFLYFRIQVTF